MCALAALSLAVLATGVSGAAAAEKTWVREINLTLRTGPGVKYKIIGGVSTGDVLKVIGRQAKWTHVQTAEGIDGWVPAGYLKTEQPALIAMARHDAQVGLLTEQLESARLEAKELRESSQVIRERDKGQREEIERLTFDNVKLRSATRWLEWIAGASVLGTGMLLGAALHRSATRRSPSRLRL